LESHLNSTAESEQIDADVLVLGGGFGGAWAALRASELGARVVLVEKAHVSRSGASTMSGGITTCPIDSDDLSVWAEEFISHGAYMCDQAWTWQLLEGARERVKTIASWGVPISRDADGTIRRFASRGMIDVRCMQYQPKKTMEELRRRLLANGVRICDRVAVVDLFTSDGAHPTTGSITGALGFGVRDGKTYVFRAKRTVLAMGVMAMKGKWHIDNVTGDGAAIAYRAGARLVDLEMGCGGTFTVLMKHYDLGGYNVAVAHGARLINAQGERFMEKYDPVRFERSELSRVVAAFVKEINDGRGPCYIDLRPCDASYWSDLESLWARGSQILLSDQIPNPRENPLLIEPQWGAWAHGMSGVQIDLQCRANLDGLFATGSNAKNKATGTHSSAGSPTAFAMNSGYYAGQTAAYEARELTMPVLIADDVRSMIEAMRAPLTRPVGTLSPDDIHDQMAWLETSVVDGVLNNAAKLYHKLEVVEEMEAALATCYAPDPHELAKFHEARNIVEFARAQYLSALDRTESRESFYREDFPETNDDAWFVWHGITRTPAGVPAFDREPIPLEGAALQPASRGGRRLSPVAAMMSGSYDPAMYA
jgi:succinate dehydrogenase / fumarate reductase flavoprotein subunit